MNLDIGFYVALFLRRIHYFLILAVLGSAIGITLAVVLPAVYKAEALLIVESQQIPDELAATTVQTETTEQLQIIQQRILTRDSLLEMANRLGIYAPRAGEVAERMPADEIVQDMRNRITIETTGGASSRGPVQATIVRVSFEAPTAIMSATVTNEVVTLILQENVEIRTSVAGQTLEFFTEEVARLDQELATRGAEILAFQERNLEALPDSLEFRRQQQSAAQERLAQVERDEDILRDRRDRLFALYERTGDVGGLNTPVSNQTPEQRQLQSLKDELNTLLAVLSPENPRVKVMQAQVSALEKTVASQTAAGVEISATGLPLTAFEIQVADLDGQLDFLAAQKRQIKNTMEALRVSIEATPGNAITLDTLERDYANLRAQYDQAVSNRARAETGDTIEALAKGQRISVIEQAVAPREPVRPNRTILAAGGVGGGMMLGLTLVVLLELFSNAIRRPVDLTSKLGITPFGTVPLIRTRWEVVRRQTIIFASFAIAIVLIPAILWFVHVQVIPLDSVVDWVKDKAGL
ncbi:MAG: lipopolysaccharide biosynthesis protein [Pseudomonadota bacterium]